MTTSASSIFLRGDGRGDASVLHHSCNRRISPARRAAHGLQCLGGAIRGDQPVDAAEQPRAARNLVRRSRGGRRSTGREASDPREEFGPVAHRNSHHRRPSVGSWRLLLCSGSAQQWMEGMRPIHRSNSQAATCIHEELLCLSQSDDPLTSRRGGALRPLQPRHREQLLQTIPSDGGSQRQGPDLARVGAKYSDEWHVGPA